MPAQPPVLLTDIIAALEESQRISIAGESPAGKRISAPASLMAATAGSIIWIAPARADKEQLLAATAARTIVGDDSLKPLAAAFPDKTFLLVENPRLFFIRLCNTFFAPAAKSGIHPSAIIDPEADIHPEAWIGPGAVIGKCRIGAGSQIMGSCFLYDGVLVGRNVTIHAGTVIGADGFGYQRNEEGAFEKFPHLGGVTIEDEVEIGSNTCIDRGTLDDTLIRKGAKIDNLVHIAHNVVVGENAAVIALAMIGGSTRIGDGTWIAPSAALRDGLSIGAGAMIGMGAVVTKPVPAGETWTGSPARELAAFLAMQQKLK